MIEQYRGTQPTGGSAKILRKRFFERKEYQVMQTLITVGIIVLVFALITALLIPLMKKMNQSARLWYELNRDGVTVQGHIISGYEHYVQERGGGTLSSI